LVDARGIPLASTLTGGHRNDVTQLIPLVERIPQVRGRVGRPRRRPARLTAAWGSKTRSCAEAVLRGCFVFVDESAEQFVFSNAPCGSAGGR
jgi:hypothetical protein